MHVYDVVIVGAGIVGLATALELQERAPGLSIALLEKENDVALHQSGHNSGVVHSGVYYRPGSLKAQFCVQGARALLAFCDRYDVPYIRSGKVIVAVDELELRPLEDLLRRANANGVPGARLIGPSELHELEPHADGIAALHSPAAAIVDYRLVARRMVDVLMTGNTRILTGHGVFGLRTGSDGSTISTTAGTVNARNVINCAGLYADRIAALAGVRPDVRIVPFRGEYWLLRPDRRHLVRSLIYPVPDPNLPFLGVHFTRTIDDRVEAGPNAVLALHREGYQPWHFQMRDVVSMLTYRGFFGMAQRNWRTGLTEIRRSISKRSFAAAAQRLVPEIRIDDLTVRDAGVRAQAVAADGSLVDDFVIHQAPRSIHVLNAPSPAATACLAIGKYISDLALERFVL